MVDGSIITRMMNLNLFAPPPPPQGACKVCRFGCYTRYGKNMRSSYVPDIFNSSPPDFSNIPSKSQLKTALRHVLLPFLFLPRLGFPYGTVSPASRRHYPYYA